MLKLYSLIKMQHGHHHSRLYAGILIPAMLAVPAAVSAFPAGSDSTARRKTAAIAEYISHAMLFNRGFPQEKVYLHFDNTGYFKGERIWYKAYVVRADNGMATDISRVLYVELVSPGGDVVETQKLQIGKDGTAHGDILLDKILGTGFYEVRAYTRYMTNWGEDGIFSRVFPVFKKPEREGDYSRMEIDRVGYRKRLPDMREKDIDSADVENKNMRVRFYPEGGRMVKGLKSRVAFIVTDGEGRRTPTSGTLTSPEDGTDSIVTDARGRGLLEVTADEAGSRLMLKDGRGRTGTFELPDAEDEGCVLSVDAVSGEDVDVRIRSSAGMCGRLLGYAVTHNGSVVECDTFTAVPEYRRSLPRVSLPEGVSQTTVFDSDGWVLADRLFFVCPAAVRECGISVEPLTEGLSPCGRVRIGVSAAPDASISFSAVDCATMTGGKRGSIYTWMLLSSEVKGYIENPEYYFESDDEEHRREADMLMMTQGWRRYDWRLMSGAEIFDKMQPAEDRLYLFGQIKDKRQGRSKSSKCLNAFLYNSKGGSLKGSAIIDSIGNYAFSLPDISGDWNLQFQTTEDGRKTDCIVTIDRNFSPRKRFISPEEKTLMPINAPNVLTPSKDEKSINNRQPAHSLTGNNMLPTVNIRRYFTNDKNTRWFDESSGAYFASIYYNCEEACELLNDQGVQIPLFFDWLMSRNKFITGNSLLSDVLLRNPDSDVARPEDYTEKGNLKAKAKIPEKYTDLDFTYHFNPPVPWRTLYNDGITYKNRPVVWIVNNTYCTITHFFGNRLTVDYCNNHTNVTELPQYLDEVKSVYITENKDAVLEYIVAEEINRLNPVIAFVYTYPKYTSESSRGIRRTHFQGFNVPTTFKTEDYSVLPPTEDFRRTIYWNPDVRTDKEGKATVEFYNNSNCTRMYVSVEGMTKDGRFVANE